MPLPRDVDVLAAPTLAGARERARAARRGSRCSALTALLYYSAGVTRKKTYPGGGEVLFRAAASTGALYQTEVYVGGRRGRGARARALSLLSGRLHAAPAARRRRARGAGRARRPSRRWRGARRRSWLSAIYWRNTWKYQARGYRHLFWDSGTMLANVLAVGGRARPGARACSRASSTTRSIACSASIRSARRRWSWWRSAPRGRAGGAARRRCRRSRTTSCRCRATRSTIRCCARCTRPPASPAPTTVMRLAARRRRRRRARRRGPLVALPRAARATSRSLGETIQRRGSTRQFGARAAVGARSSRPRCGRRRGRSPADVPAGLVDLYLIVNAVDGVAPGAYAYWPGHGLELVRAGDVPARGGLSHARAGARRRRGGDHLLPGAARRDPRAPGAIAAIAWPTSRPGSPAAAPTSPPTRRASAPAGSRSTTPRSSRSSRRTRPGATRSSSPRSAAPARARERRASIELDLNRRPRRP